MIPSFFGFTRFETDATPGQAFQAWSLGSIVDVLENTIIIRLVSGAMSRSGPTGDGFRWAGHYTDAFSKAGLTGDKLES